MLKQLELVVVSDLLNFSSSPERVGNCSKGAIGNCSCLSSIFHFSTYGTTSCELVSRPGLVLTCACSCC